MRTIAALVSLMIVATSAERLRLNHGNKLRGRALTRHTTPTATLTPTVLEVLTKDMPGLSIENDLPLNLTAVKSGLQDLLTPENVSSASASTALATSPTFIVPTAISVAMSKLSLANLLALEVTAMKSGLQDLVPIKTVSSGSASTAHAASPTFIVPTAISAAMSKLSLANLLALNMTAMESGLRNLVAIEPVSSASASATLAASAIDIVPRAVAVSVASLLIASSSLSSGFASPLLLVQATTTSLAAITSTSDDLATITTTITIDEPSPTAIATTTVNDSSSLLTFTTTVQDVSMSTTVTTSTDDASILTSTTNTISDATSTSAAGSISTSTSDVQPLDSSTATLTVQSLLATMTADSSTATTTVTETVYVETLIKYTITVCPSASASA